MKKKLRERFGDLITKIAINKWWLNVEIKRPQNKEFENGIIKSVESFCNENWEYKSNIIVGWES